MPTFLAARFSTDNKEHLGDNRLSNHFDIGDFNLGSEPIFSNFYVNEGGAVIAEENNLENTVLAFMKGEVDLSGDSLQRM